MFGYYVQAIELDWGTSAPEQVDAVKNIQKGD